MKKWIKASFLILVTLLMGISAAQAAGGKRLFRVVLAPERNIFEQQRKYQNICDYVCEQLPLKFQFEVLKGYKEVLAAMKEGRADGAFMGSFIATYSIDNYGYIPLLRPVLPSGASHYRSYIFKRAGLPVTRDVATWKGLSFVFVNPYTSAGYFLPLSLMQSNGVKEPGEFFSKVQFSGSHDAAVWMVANGMGDIGAAKDTVFNDFVKRKPELGKMVELLYVEGRYPESTLVVVPETPQEVREAIRNVFLRMGSDQGSTEILKMFGAQKFMITTPDEYDEVRKIVSTSGYEIKNINILGE